MPVKSPTLTMTFGIQKGQESATALVQVLGKGTNHRERIPMGRLSTLFQAEVKAIPRCTE